MIWYSYGDINIKLELNVNKLKEIENEIIFDFFNSRLLIIVDRFIY